MTISKLRESVQGDSWKLDKIQEFNAKIEHSPESMGALINKLFDAHTRRSPTANAVTDDDKRAEGRECFNCGKLGHYARNCTKPKKQGNSKDFDSKGKCAKCHKGKHPASECRGSKTATASNVNNTDDEEVNSATVANCQDVAKRFSESVSMIQISESGDDTDGDTNNPLDEEAEVSDIESEELDEDYREKQVMYANTTATHQSDNDQPTSLPQKADTALNTHTGVIHENSVDAKVEPPARASTRRSAAPSTPAPRKKQASCDNEQPSHQQDEPKGKCKVATTHLKVEVSKAAEVQYGSPKGKRKAASPMSNAKATRLEGNGTPKRPFVVQSSPEVTSIGSTPSPIATKIFAKVVTNVGDSIPVKTLVAPQQADIDETTSLEMHLSASERSKQVAIEEIATTREENKPFQQDIEDWCIQRTMEIIGDMRSSQPVCPERRKRSTRKPKATKSTVCVKREKEERPQPAPKKRKSIKCAAPTKQTKPRNARVATSQPSTVADTDWVDEVPTDEQMKQFAMIDREFVTSAKKRTWYRSNSKSGHRAVLETEYIANQEEALGTT
ncbi:MAG: hypothetical protein COB29_13180 [Sulfitobacter sp.]|nr:MAG: hypothetical protein COB29_13180 [Sulfitobacter sp.]